MKIYLFLREGMEDLIRAHSFFIVILLALLAAGLIIRFFLPKRSIPLNNNNERVDPGVIVFDQGTKTVEWLPAEAEANPETKRLKTI